VLFFAVQTFVHVLDSDKTNFSANYVNWRKQETV
jgi:hypothetical protein